MTEIKKKNKKRKKTRTDNKFRNAVISCIRMSYARYSPNYEEKLNEGRKEEELINKDGSVSKKKKVSYSCEMCNEFFPSKEIEINHIEQVIPLNLTSRHVSLQTIFDRINCPIEGLQRLCKACHSEVTAQERITRTENIKKEKFIVYEVINNRNYKKYIGVHRCVDLDDGYMGSGVAIKSAIKKYGKSNFSRSVIAAFDSLEKALDLEKQLVTSDRVEDPEYYNLTTGGRGGPRGGETTYVGENNPNYGKTHSGEVRKKIADRYYPTGVEHEKAKAVICVETGEVFDSITEAQATKGVKHISRSIKTGGTSGGFHWNYLEDPVNVELKPERTDNKPVAVKCVELDRVFKSCNEAIVELNLSGASSHRVKKACETGNVYKGYTWEFTKKELK